MTVPLTQFAVRVAGSYFDSGATEFTEKRLELDEGHVSVKLTVWDTSEQDEAALQASGYYHGAEVVLLLFSTDRCETRVTHTPMAHSPAAARLSADSARSLASVDVWLRRVMARCPRDAVVAVVQTKADLIGAARTDTSSRTVASRYGAATQQVVYRRWCSTVQYSTVQYSTVQYSRRCTYEYTNLSTNWVHEHGHC
jgi:GTPase SAR1 family protein